MKRIVIEKELGATPTIFESEVVDILVQNGFVRKHVLFLKPNRTPGARTPDIQIDRDLKWEIKSLMKDGKYTLEHALRAGLSQSKNLIVDVRKLNKNIQKKYSEKIEKEYYRRKSWRGVVIVLKGDGSGAILTFMK